MLTKFNNIRDLADARYAAAMMAEWVGFSVGNIDSLPAEKIKEIMGWCAGPKLILEIEKGIGAEVIQSYMLVLPVDGLEVGMDDYLMLKNDFNEDNLIWILNHSQLQIEEKKNIIYHSDKINMGENYIQKTNGELPDTKKILQDKPWAISMTCVNEDENNFKDFERWNDFFESLDKE